MGGKLQRSLLITGIAGLLLIAIMIIFFYKTFTSLNVINALFNSGLIFLIIGSAFFVIQGGFFNGITYGFKKFFNTISKSSQYLSEIEADIKDENKKNKELYVKKERHLLTWSCLIVGLTFFLISFVLSYLIY